MSLAIGRVTRVEAFVYALLAVLIMAGLGANALAQQVFFEPREPVGSSAQSAADPDWHRFFRLDSPWRQAASQIQVFSLTAAYVTNAPDDELRELATWAAARGIALNVVVQPVAVDPNETCGKFEGYDSPEHVARIAAKLRRLGIRPQYVALDGPFWSGHYSPGKCRFSIEEAALRTARNVLLFLDHFPDVLIEEIESDIIAIQPNWRSDYETFRAAFETAARHPINLITLDVKWPSPGWAENVRALHATAKSLGLKFGVIYNGDDRDDSDHAWIAHAMRNFTRVESELGIIPDRADFVTWNAYPTHALPESAPDTMTWLINHYHLPRTRFEARLEGQNWRIRLVNESGRSIAGQQVMIARLGIDPSQPLPVRTASGLVPSAAASAILGLRINAECFCAGPNDLLLTGASYTEGGTGSVRKTLDLTQLADRTGTDGVLASRTDGALRLTVRPDQHVVFNSPRFAVTPGAPFEFRVPLGSLGSDGLYGFVTIIWIDADGKGLSRTNVGDTGDHVSAGTATTGADGGIVLPAINSVQELSFAGTISMRPALARLDPVSR